MIVPLASFAGRRPVVVDLKGVSWDYAPLDLSSPPPSARLLGAEQARFAYVVPSFRGEALLFGGRRWTSEGDRTDGWDGAADDAIAILSVALSRVPGLDSSRVGVFGRSRGGSVALLVGERDPRVSCVVDWAGPADWFEAMGLSGFTQKELAAEALRAGSAPNQVGGQFRERFLEPAKARMRGLAGTRLAMLASSPLWFTGSLPRVQLHYGVDDRAVPRANGDALASRLEPARARGRAEAIFYPDAGHDLDRERTPEETRRFLLESLAGKATLAAGRRRAAR